MYSWNALTLFVTPKDRQVNWYSQSFTSKAMYLRSLSLMRDLMISGSKIKCSEDVVTGPISASILRTVVRCVIDKGLDK